MHSGFWQDGCKKEQTMVFAGMLGFAKWGDGEGIFLKSKSLVFLKSKSLP